MADPEDEEEFSELVAAQFNRVDLVQAPANGSPGFLVMKQAESAGLLEPEFVRDLIAKAEPEGRERVTMPSGVTLTGSPADIAAFIHKAAVRDPDDIPGEGFQVGSAHVQVSPDDVAKAEMSGKSINDLPDSAFAFIESGGKKDDEGKTTPRSLRHFPVHDKSHADNAAARIAQGAEFGDEAAPKVHAAQRRFGEKKVSKESDVADTVTKADMGPELDEGVDGLDPTIPLAAPEDDAPGDPTDPGSPAWEAIDAATASKWASILARAKVALGVMADREMLEAAAADPSDAENAFDLDDAACAIDYAISVLAPFAVGEQSESDCGAAELEAVGKALAGFDSAPLEAVEGLTAIAKAGRVLSSANESLIRTAGESLQKVLMSLPSAPVADEPVTKEATVPDVLTEAQPVAKAEDAAPETVTAPADEVVKADEPEGKAKMVAVFDSKGDLVGVCDPGDITPIAGADAPAANEEEAAAPAEAPAADPADLAPAPAAEAGTPAEDVAKSDDTTDEREVLKSIVAEAVAAALDARTQAEDVAKAAVAGVSEEVETLKARIETLEEQPAMPKVFTNGATPPPGTLRGQDQGSAPVGVAKARELKHTLYKGTAAEQNEAAREMQEAAIAQLSAIHSAPRR